MEGMYQEKSPGPRIDPWGPPNASQPDGNMYKKDRHRLYNYSVVLKGIQNGCMTYLVNDNIAAREHRNKMRPVPRFSCGFSLQTSYQRDHQYDVSCPTQAPPLLLLVPMTVSDCCWISASTLESRPVGQGEDQQKYCCSEDGLSFQEVSAAAGF